MIRASKRNDARRNKTALGPLGRDETSLKIEDFRSNKTTGKLSKIPQQNVQITYTVYKAVTNIIS
jgi:hypothetical protein